MCKLVGEYSENEDDQVWAARTLAALEVWLDWLAALLQPD